MRVADAASRIPQPRPLRVRLPLYVPLRCASFQQAKVPDESTSLVPVEGGSCNDYDCVCGDPVNISDLSGQCPDGCVAEAGLVVVAVGALIILIHLKYNPEAMAAAAKRSWDYIFNVRLARPGFMQARGKQRGRDTGLQNVPDRSDKRASQG